MVGDLVQSLITGGTDAHRGDEPVVHLCGGPYVTVGGDRVEVPEGSQRLLAYVALHRRPVPRRQVAGALWPVGDEHRAAGNLRSALWRLNGTGLHLVAADQHALRATTWVDVHVVSDWATRLVGECPRACDLVVAPWEPDAFDILAGWYEDWALVERERFRHRMLHALEALSRLLARAGRCAEAVEAAMTAVAFEPLRESAQRALLEAHLAEGNVGEARRSFEAYAGLLRRELAVEPGARLAALLAGGVDGLPAPRRPLAASTP